MMEILIPLLVLVLIWIVVFKIKSHYRNKYRTEIGYVSSIRKGYGFIYWYQGRFEISNLLLVKIGRTNNLQKRMSAAKTSNPFGIRLIGCVSVRNDVLAETYLHRKFGKYRINKGNEWFFYHPKLLFYLWCINDSKLLQRYK
jgi:hypothetical protein